MSVFELEHPLGQDLEKLNQSMIAGMEKVTEKYHENIMLRFYNAMSNDKGISVLKMANWTTKNQVYMELPLFPPEGDVEWTVDWGTGVEPVVYRIRIQDMVGRGFYVEPLDGEPELIHTKYLNYDVTSAGIALVLKKDEMFNRDESAVHYGAFEGQLYDLFLARARREASIGELVILADAA